MNDITRLYLRENEEIIATITKNWEKMGRAIAPSVLEAAKAAKAGLMALKKCPSLNNIWHIYERYPEVVLFPQILGTIKEAYLDAHAPQGQRRDKQLSTFEFSLNKMYEVAQVFYPNFKSISAAELQKELDATEATLTSVPYENRKITSGVRGTLKHNSTLLPKLFSPESLKDPQTQRMLVYLSDHNVITVGDFMKFLNEHNRDFSTYISITGLSAPYRQLREGIFAMHDRLAHLHMSDSNASKGQMRESSYAVVGTVPTEKHTEVASTEKNIDVMPATKEVCEPEKEHDTLPALYKAVSTGQISPLEFEQRLHALAQATNNAENIMMAINTMVGIIKSVSETVEFLLEQVNNTLFNASNNSKNNAGEGKD